MISLLAGFAIMAAASAAPSPYLDLHAHLFMEDGMGTLFHGRFDGELRAKDWKASFDSQINAQSLEASQLGVLVVSVYAHPIFSNGKKEAVRREIAKTERFVQKHPEWVIARSAEEAMNARAHGKRVIILALEGASGVLESEEDLREFIDEKGIRIVTLLHLTDDHYGGAAFFRAFRGFIMTPLSWFWQIFDPKRDADGVKLNRNGLTEEGAELARKLIARKVWIDLAHSSDEAQKTLISMLKAAHQPLLYTHTSLRKYLRAERGIADWQIAEVKATGGIIGLMPSEEVLEGTPEKCPDGVHELADQFSAVASSIGAASTSIGSDFNGGINHLAPPKCPTGTPIDREGAWNIGQSGEIWGALKSLGVPWPKSSDEFITAFLKAWARI